MFVILIGLRESRKVIYTNVVRSIYARQQRQLISRIIEVPTTNGMGCRVLLCCAVQKAGRTSVRENFGSQIGVKIEFHGLFVDFAIRREPGLNSLLIEAVDRNSI
jgi:hypothetical protein